MHEEDLPNPEIEVEVEVEDTPKFRSSSRSLPPKQAGDRVASRGISSTGNLPPGLTYKIQQSLRDHVQDGDSPPLGGTGEVCCLAPDGSTILSTTIVTQGRDEADARKELRLLAMVSILSGFE